jgi:hypothetical protein
MSWQHVGSELDRCRNFYWVSRCRACSRARDHFDRRYPLSTTTSFAFIPCLPFSRVTRRLPIASLLFQVFCLLHLFIYPCLPHFRCPPISISTWSFPFPHGPISHSLPHSTWYLLSISYSLATQVYIQALGSCKYDLGFPPDLDSSHPVWFRSRSRCTSPPLTLRIVSLTPIYIYTL